MQQRIARLAMIVVTLTLEYLEGDGKWRGILRRWQIAL